MSEEWLRTLSDTLKDHETPAPEGLWEEIDARLFPQKKRRMLPLIFRWAATVLLVGGIPFYVNTFLVPKTAAVLTITPAAESTEAEALSTSRKTNTVAEYIEAKAPQAHLAVKIPPRQPAEFTEAKAPQAHLAVKIPPRQAAESIEAEFFEAHLAVKYPPRQPAESIEAESSQSHLVAKISPRQPAESIEAEAKTLSFYSAQSGSDFTQNVGGFARVSGTPLSFTALNPEMDKVIEGTREQEVRTDIHHDIPITLGVQGAVALKGNWSVNAGLSYTRMGSSSYSGTAGYAVRTRQEVHYLGAPVQVQYRFNPGKRLSVYAGTGLLFEKAVAGKLTHRYIVDYSTISESSERLAELPSRWSANVGVGVEARVLSKVDVYVEPHFRYNFKEQSCITTVHDVRPAQAGLKLGLRYNLR